MFDIVISDIDVLSTIERLGQIDFTPFLRDSAEFVNQNVQMRMEAGISPRGGIQPENVGQYAKWKREHFPGKPPLILTGALKAGIIETIEGDSEAWVHMKEGMHPGSPRPRGYEYSGGTYEEVALRQEKGAYWSSEPRPFLEMTNEEQEEVFRRFCNLFNSELM